MRGFTTVRDLGGAVFGLKAAIDQGVIPGPRIYPSGAMISVTSGHGDFRSMSVCRVRWGRLRRVMTSLATAPLPTVQTKCVCAPANS